VADTPEAVRAGGLEGIEDRLDPVAQLQVGVPDDRGAGERGAVDAARGHGGLPLDELDLPDRTALDRPGSAVHHPRLDEHGGADVVALVHVGKQLGQQVALIRDALGPPVPEVVMRVADRELWFQDRLLREP